MKKSSLMTGDILCRSIYSPTGKLSFQFGIYNATTDKVCNVAFFSKRSHAPEEWRYAFVFRYKNLPENQRMRIADDKWSILERLDLSKEPRYGIWNFIKTYLGKGDAPKLKDCSFEYVNDVYTCAELPRLGETPEELMGSPHLRFLDFLV